MRQKSEQFNSDTGKQPIFLLLNRPIGKHPNKWVWVVSKLKCGSPLFVPSKHFFFQLNQVKGLGTEKGRKGFIFKKCSTVHSY